MRLLLILLMSSFFYSFSAQDSQKPKNFPPSIEIAQLPFENWSKEIQINSIWTAFPKTTLDIIQIANWVVKNDFKLRPSGNQHSWTPITVTQSSPANNKTVIIKMKIFNTIKMAPLDEFGLPSVLVGTGTTINDLLTFLQKNGFGIAAVPQMGDATVGGTIAVGGHGSSLKNTNKTQNEFPGLTFTSFSNSIIQLTALVWNESGGKFELKTFNRSDSEINVLMTNIGRILVTEVRLRVGKDAHVRCVSTMDHHVNKLFAPPLDGGDGDGEYTENSLAALYESSDSINAIHFPFTSNPWVRMWTRSKVKPERSREVTSPYNYPFTDNMPDSVTKMLAVMQNGNSKLTPVFTKAYVGAIKAGLLSSQSSDIWGLTRDVNLIVKNSTLFLVTRGLVVLTSRMKLQRVLYEAFQVYNGNIESFEQKEKYPMNGALYIKISSTDNTQDAGLQGSGAECPIFAPATPFKQRKEMDIAIVVDMQTFVRAGVATEFFQKVVTEFGQLFNGDYAVMRPKWDTKFGDFSSNDSWIYPDGQQSVMKVFSGSEDGRNFIGKMDPKNIFENENVHRMFR